MKTRLAATFACIVAALVGLQVDAQTKAAIINQKREEAWDQNKILQEKLEDHFSLTEVNDQNGVVESKGTPYVVVKSGIHAIPMQGNFYWPNYYFKNGHVHQPIVQASSSSSADGNTSTISVGLRLPWQAGGSRPIEANEYVYITQILVNGRTASFFLQTCTQNIPVSRARIDLHFATKNLTDTDLEEVLETAAELLVDPEAPSSPSPEIAANDNSQPDVPAIGESYMVHTGMTQDQVRSMLGEPQKIKHERQFLLFLYEGFVVQFEGDSVTSVAAR